jgi:hypothetical protein
MVPSTLLVLEQKRKANVTTIPTLTQNTKTGVISISRYTIMPESNCAFKCPWFFSSEFTTGDQRIKFLYILSLAIGLGLLYQGQFLRDVSNATPISKKIFDSNQKPLCNRAQIQSGEWIETNETSPTWYVERKQSVRRNSCNRKNANLTYAWQPDDHSTCEFVEWDESHFCTLMRGAPILLLGDSLTYEHYLTLVSALGGTTSGNLHGASSEHEMTIVQAVCEHQQTFAMYHLLRSLDHRIVDRILTEHFPVVVVMNQGAHFKPNPELTAGLEPTFRVVAKWQKRCRDYGIKCHFFWRTTVPGTDDCGDFSAPVNDLSRMETHVRNGRNASAFRWKYFKFQNSLVSSLLASFATSNQNNTLDTTILDAYHLNILRPDQHRRPNTDCLHNCLPGKVSIYNRLLLHWLVNSRSMEDVGMLESLNFPWNRTSNVLPDGNGVIFPDGRKGVVLALGRKTNPTLYYDNNTYP